MFEMRSGTEMTREGADEQSEADLRSGLLSQSRPSSLIILPGTAGDEEFVG